jgi:hypothetical protein
MADERQLRLDESLPGELVLIGVFALFFVLIVGLLLG